MNIQHRHNRGNARECQEEVTNFSLVYAQEELTINKFSKRIIKLFCSKMKTFFFFSNASHCYWRDKKDECVVKKTRDGEPFNIECRDILAFHSINVTRQPLHKQMRV